MPGLCRRGREGSPAAAVQRRGSPVRRQSFWGLRLENPPCALAPSIAIKPRGAFPTSLPWRRDLLLLTLMARQEPAPFLAANPLLGQRRIPAPRLCWLGWKSTGCLTSANPACASTSSSARSCWVSFARGKQVSHRGTEEIGSASPPRLGFLSPRGCHCLVPAQWVVPLLRVKKALHIPFLGMQGFTPPRR